MPLPQRQSRPEKHRRDTQKKGNVRVEKVRWKEMCEIQKAEVALKCTKCGHLVPSPSESTSDDTLVICPACGADLGTWGEAKSSK